MKKVFSFDDFWEASDAAVKAHNGFCYHSCCDIWTSRSGKSARATHKKTLKWKEITKTLDKLADKKLALLAKMTGEGWRIPLVLNEACSSQPKPNFQTQSAFRLHISDQPPQDVQADFSSPDFIYPDQPPSELVTPSSKHYLT